MSASHNVLPGLCSVTFRQLDADEVIREAAAAGVCGIEWGGDVHARPGDLVGARAIAARCADAGVAVPSYGSYLRLDDDEPVGDAEAALDTAEALGAANIRVWAGRKGPGEATPGGAKRIAARLRSLAEAAAARGRTVSVEYHRGTLTETAVSAVQLLRIAEHPNLFCYWQPVPERTEDQWLTELRVLQPALSHLHVFHWLPGNDRRPLVEGKAYWRRMLAAFTPSPRWRSPAFAFLEFVAGDSVGQFTEDLAVLREICGGQAAYRASIVG